MVANIANAVAAYSSAVKRAGEGGGMVARDIPTGPSFSDLIEDGIKETIDVARQSEKMSAQAAIGRADLTDVVTAVSNAEVTLQTVVAVRDRVIQAYQEILRMPI